MDVDLFTADLDGLSTKMTSGERDELVQRMNFVKNRLIELYKKNLVKINHSVMELVCARHLIRYGYAVDVEKQLTDILVCDLHGNKGNGDTVVEIETGFVLPIPEMYRRPPRDRRIEEITKLKRVCDKYYRNPPITEEEIVNGRIHMIYIIDIDQGNVIEMDVESYFESVRLMTPISSIIYGSR